MLNAKQKKHLLDLSQKKALLEGLGHRKALLEGLGHRKALLEGLGHRKALLEGLGHRKALLEGLGHRKALLEGLGHRKALLESLGLGSSAYNSYSVGSYPRDFYSIPPPDISPSPLPRTASPALSYSPTALRDLRLDSPPHRTSSLSVEPSREKESSVTKVKPESGTDTKTILNAIAFVVLGVLFQEIVSTYLGNKSTLHIVLFLLVVVVILVINFSHRKEWTLTKNIFKKVPDDSKNS